MIARRASGTTATRGIRGLGPRSRYDERPRPAPSADRGLCLSWRQREIELGLPAYVCRADADAPGRDRRRGFGGDHEGLGHLCRLTPFADAALVAGHEVLVASPELFGANVEAAGSRVSAFGDIPPEDFAAVLREAAPACR